jgi:hypothetical protein
LTTILSTTSNLRLPHVVVTPTLSLSLSSATSSSSSTSG